MDRAIEILEELINELEDQTVGNMVIGRQKKYETDPSKKNLYNLKRAFVAVGKREGRKAERDLANLKKEVEAERSGEAERKQKVKALKDTLKHGNAKQAEQEHQNAQLNQGLRNKLEKIYKGKTGTPVIEALLELPISEACLNELLDLIVENTL